MWNLRLPRSGALALLACSALLSACSGLRSVSSEVSSFGEWPAGRAPGTYAFERLPSQQAQAGLADALEASAMPALQKAGFTPATGGREPDVLIQLGARDAVTALHPWDDPLWWRGGFGYWRHGPWLSSRWGLGMRFESPRYETQVGVLIRDRSSGKPLFETRAATEGNTRADRETLAAMFEAALIDFPRTGLNPRQVVVTLPAR